MGLWLMPIMISLILLSLTILMEKVIKAMSA